MGGHICRSLLLVPLVLASCSGEVTEGRLAHADRMELLAILQLGRPVLDCRDACLSEWKRVQPRAAQLDAKAQWGELAVLVMRSGYQDDLSLYYLGKAAEGLGFYAAASNYYRQSKVLSGTSIACANLSRMCGDVSLPSSSIERLAAAERMLVPHKTRPRRSTINSLPLTPDPTPERDPISATESTAPPITAPVPPTRTDISEPTPTYIEPPSPTWMRHPLFWARP
jgi:hypothetical protein